MSETYHATQPIVADGTKYEAGDELKGVSAGCLKSMVRLGQADAKAPAKPTAKTAKK